MNNITIKTFNRMSVKLANQALQESNAYITKHFGKEIATAKKQAKHLWQFLRTVCPILLRNSTSVQKIKASPAYKKSQAYLSPRVARTIMQMDIASKFMMDRHYECKNPAIAAVRMPLVAGFWSILILTSVTLIWGTLAPIDSAAVAKGTVTLLSNKKVIQHLEGGMIEKIYVKDGDTVKAGDSLIKLSDTVPTANRDILQSQLYEERASEARFIAMRDQLTEIHFPQDIVAGSKNNEAINKIMATQIRLFDSQVSAQSSKMAALKQRIIQAGEQINGQTAQKNSTASQLEILKQNVASIEKLVESGFDTKTHLTTVQRNQMELEGNLGQYDAEIAKIQQGITEAQMTLSSQASDFETTISDGLRESQAKVADLTEKLRAAQDVAERTVIAAPASGIINGLKHHTIGGIIQPGVPIMDIIPQNDQLIIEAHVRPGDIDVVRAGLNARVIFTAYKAGSTPRIDGRVIQVSADRINDTQSSPPDSYYVALVEVDKNILLNTTKHIELYPGMPADVLIRTGSRSFLNYLFSPIMDSMHRAFREE